MLRVGVAGVGFMSWIHYLAYQKVRGVKLAAICSRDAKKRAGDWRGIQGNFGPPGQQIDVSSLRAFSDLEELLGDPGVDLIDVCLPPHLHADVSIRALKAGKHVLVEKPMALTNAECNRMVAAADKAGKQLLVGHVLPYFPEYAYAHKLIESGKYGKLIGGNFKRVIADPLWLEDFYDPRRVGGPLVDLHVHDAHFIRLAFGMPTAVFSQGRMRGEVVEYCNTIFQFADPDLVVTATSGVIDQPGRPFTHAYEIHFEQATMQFEFAAFSDGSELMPLKILARSGKVIRPDLGDGDPVRGFEAEMKEVVRSIRSGQPSPILSGALARDAIVLCHKQTDSGRRQKLVKI